MSNKTQSPVDKWALFRFSVVGGLLAKPPAKGELQKELRQLARQRYVHPVHNRLTVFHFSTIESWYYRAKNAQDPILALSRKFVLILAGQLYSHLNSLPFLENNTKPTQSGAISFIPIILQQK